MKSRLFSTLLQGFSTLAFASLILTGCGQSSPSPSSTNTPSTQPTAQNTAPIDVCSFFNAEDIAQKLGKNFISKNDSVGTDFSCTYQTDTRRDTTTVTVRRLSRPNQAEDWYQLLEANKDASKIQQIPGIGEKAEFIPDSMMNGFATHKGGIFVSVVNSTFEDERFLDIAKFMVQRVLEKAQ